MSGKPGNDLLGTVGCDEYVGRPGQRDPFADVRPERLGLPAGARAIATAGRGVLFVARYTRRHEPEPSHDSPCLMGGEVGPVEAGRARENLLRREPTAPHNHIVLPNRVGKQVIERTLDAVPFELELLAGNRELCHFLNCIL